MEALSITLLITCLATSLALNWLLLSDIERHKSDLSLKQLLAEVHLSVVLQDKELWKDYAIAQETIYDCIIDAQEAPSYSWHREAIAQWRRAANSAKDAANELYESGEYPDALTTCPLLVNE